MGKLDDLLALGAFDGGRAQSLAEGACIESLSEVTLEDVFGIAFLVGQEAGVCLLEGGKLILGELHILESHVDELHECGDILGSGGAGHGGAVGVDADAELCLLSGEILLQIGVGVGAETERSHEERHGDDGVGIVGGASCIASETGGSEKDLIVLELGGLDDHLRTVRKGPLGGAPCGVLLGRHDLAGHGSGGDEWLGLLLVDKRLDGLGVNRCQSGCDGLLGGESVALLLGSYHEDGTVVGSDYLAHGLVDGLDGEHGCELLDDLPVSLDAGDSLAIGEIAHVFLHIVFILTRVAVVILLLDSREILGLGAVILAVGETAALCAENLAVDSLERLDDVVALGSGESGHCLLAL